MGARRRGLLRLAALFALLAGGIVAVVLVVGGSEGGSASKPGGGSRSGSTRSVPQRPPKLVVRVSPSHLPGAISGEAAVTGPSGGVLSIGGLDASTVSTPGVVELRPPNAKAHSAGSLAEPLHDAAAAVVGSRTLVFGGGSTTTIDSVQSLVPGGTGSIVGHLPVSRSDLSAVTIGARAYVLGGYDGTSTVADVLSTADGRRFKRIGALPTPVRYTAVAPLGHVIYAFGGELASGQDSNAIQAIDTATHQVRLAGRLSTATSHASAVILGGRIYVLGGRSGGVATDRILAFDPATGRTSVAGNLPYAVSNAAAAMASGTGYLIGGLGADGAALDSIAILRLEPR